MLKSYLHILFLGLVCSSFTPSYGQYSLWGFTSQGGKYGAGVIFHTDSNGTNQEVVHDFYKVQGKTPGSCEMCLGSNGLLYGTTYEGSKQDNGGGVFFSYNPTDGSYKKLLEFDSSSFGTKPMGKLTLAKNGKIYGLTSWAGDAGVGNVYEYDPATNVFTKKAKFDPTLFYNSAGGMIEVEDGIFYGMTSRGGVVDKGVIFQYNSGTDVLTSKLNISISMGYSSNGGFLISANGKLYALTQEGGNGTGTLLEYDYTANTCKAKYNFQGDYGQGKYGQGTLIENGSGVFYGVTNAGGSDNIGILFQYDVNTNTFTKKVDLVWASKGAYPVSGLMKASNGKVYGITSQGGVGGTGALYEYDLTSSTFTKKVDVGDSTGTGSSFGISGNYATAPLTQAKNGKLYGLTSEGGISSSGVLFEYDPVTGVYTKKLDFNSMEDGGNPMGELLLASDGKLYGAADGGKFNLGVIYSVDPVTKQFQKEFDFKESTGFGPTSYLIEWQKGKLLGTVDGGGASGWGGFFEYTPKTKTYRILKNFDTNTGNNPVGKLVQVDGKLLYGVTQSGGVNGLGSLFSFDATSSIWTTLFSFVDSTIGTYPYTSLAQIGTKLYGTCGNGGVNPYDGTLFEYDLLTNQVKKKANFNGPINGRGPTDQLTKTSRNTLLGVAAVGGSYDLGTLFEFDPATSQIEKKFDFSTPISTGISPQVTSVPIETSPGRFFGMLTSSSSYSNAILYEYDLDSPTLRATLSFDGANGAQPFGCSLTKVPLPLATSLEEVSTVSSKGRVYPNPCTNVLYFNRMPNNVPIQVQLFDLNGQKVGSPYLLQESFQIETSFLQRGIYVAEVNDSKAVSRYPFIKD